MLNARKHILLVGNTGSGKSSTLNALAERKMSKVGIGVDSQTQKIVGYLIRPFIFWDTPGLGEGTESDKLHIKNINKIICTHENSLHKVGLVVESNKKDLGTVFKIIEEIVKPNNLADKLVIVLNQADVAMKGQGWNDEQKLPEPELIEFLKLQQSSIKRRIYESTNIDVSDITSYSAVYSYNLDNVFGLFKK